MSDFYGIDIYIMRIERKNPKLWVRIPPKAAIQHFMVWDRMPCGPLGILNFYLMKPIEYDFIEVNIPY